MKLGKIFYWIATLSMFAFAYLFFSADWIYMGVLASSVGVGSFINYFDIIDLNREDNVLSSDRRKALRNRRAEYFNSLSKEEQDYLTNQKIEKLEKTEKL